MLRVCRGSFAQPGHLDNLNENTQSFFRNFINAFEAQWRARGANEHSTRIPSAGSQNRTAEDYAYVPALKQFGAFMEELGVEAGGVCPTAPKPYLVDCVQMFSWRLNYCTGVANIRDRLFAHQCWPGCSSRVGVGAHALWPLCAQRVAMPLGDVFRCIYEKDMRHNYTFITFFESIDRRLRGHTNDIVRVYTRPFFSLATRRLLWICGCTRSSAGLDETCCLDHSLAASACRVVEEVG